MKKILICLTAMSLLISSKSAKAQKLDLMSIQVHGENANIWFFHYGEKFTWYVMECWPDNFLLTKFGPPTFNLSDSVSLTLAAGPDFSVEGKEVFSSFTIDAVPVVKKYPFYGVFVNEGGVVKDGKFFYLFRHTMLYKNVGVRYWGCGLLGEPNKDLKIGPMVRYYANKKFSIDGWFSVNPHDSEKFFEIVFDIKL